MTTIISKTGEADDFDEKAMAVLRKNDRGGFTIPTERLYPYQWNWDSAFIALGFATFDRERAWTELNLLIEGQWPNGMIPHILFRNNDPDYFPGPSVWQTSVKHMSTGGISQPPVLASIVLRLVETGNNDDLAKAEQIFEYVLNWHRWYHHDRQPLDCPVVCTVHPWETGRDNCPDWEIGLQNMAIDPYLEPYTRMDTTHANVAQRPTKEQYDKYLTIIKFGRDHDWCQVKLTNEGPFLMADPGIHFILLRADRDLLKLAHLMGKQDVISEISAWINKGVENTDYFWNEQQKAFCARDVRTGEFSNGFSNASALCFYADAGTQEQRSGTLENIERISKKVRFLMPSWDPDADLFDPQRYWCGPLWPQMNQIIARGLMEQGETKLAERIRQDLGAVIQQSGFYECFNPMSGDGCIGTDFSWTAAIWLAWISPNHTTKAV